MFDDTAPPREAAELDRFWNDLLAGQLDPAGYALAAELAETVHWVQRELRPPADAVTPRRLDPWMGTALVRPGGVAPNGRLPPAALVPPPAAQRRPAGGTVVAWLTTAALVLLLLTGALALPRLVRLSAPSAPAWPPASGGTPPATPTSSGATHLVQVTLPEPLTAAETVAFVRLTLAPGGVDREIGRADRPGPEVVYVEAGQLTARLLAGERPPLVVGPATRPEPGTATAEVVTAGAGNLLVLRSGTTVELRNDTATSAHGLWLVSNPATRSAQQQGLTWGNLGTELMTTPAGATTLTLERRTLEPNAQVVATPPQAIVVGVVDPPAGALLTNDRTGATTNISAAPRDVYVLTVGPGQAGRATPTP